MIREFVYLGVAGLLGLALGTAAGFFVGRCYVVEKESVATVRLPATSDSLRTLTPVRVETPTHPSLPVRVDTVYIDTLRQVLQTVDTAAIIAEYVMLRVYASTLFDDGYGKMDISFSTQYNQSGNLSWRFAPVQKIVTRTVRPVWQPYATGGYSGLGGWDVGGGIMYRNVGIGLQYRTDWTRSGLGIGLVYLF